MMFLVLFMISAAVLLFLGYLILDYMAILEDIETIHREYSEQQPSPAHTKQSQFSAATVLTTLK